jgi:predicted RNA-binding Zn-ribbon protein involved in translation (DUF1610 family)
MSKSGNLLEIFDQYLKDNPNAFDNGLKPHAFASSIQPKICWLHLDESVTTFNCRICGNSASWVTELPTKTKIYSCDDCKLKF